MLSIIGAHALTIVVKFDDFQEFTLEKFLAMCSTISCMNYSIAVSEGQAKFYNYCVWVDSHL